MIEFQSHTLENGLRLIVHTDRSTPLATVNILYNVGSRDEDEHRTGFAHLFEHLMFGGSKNIPSYDEPLQRVGGENNAFTSMDITNYYLTLPALSLETGLWLESDRMLELAFSEKSLEVQRSVVIEEFKQRYLNQPYGDSWLKMRDLAYTKHPYRWPTIGKEISHIEEATMEDVRAFYKKHYNPNNAILTIAGDVDFETVLPLVEKWFGPIPRGERVEKNFPKEPAQKVAKVAELTADVPYDALYQVYHIGGRVSDQFYASDFLTDILSSNESSRFYQKLIKEKPVFMELDAYVTGDIDPGLLVISGKPAPGVTLEAAELALNEELHKLTTTLVSSEEMQKNKNRAESAQVFSEVSVMNKAMNLSYFENLGDASLINSECTRYLNLTNEQLREAASTIFSPNNRSTLFYRKKSESDATV